MNNAGLSFPEKLVDLEVGHWDTTLAVNLRAPALISRVIARKMIAAGGGAIINISSNACLAGIEEHAAYCASKFGLDGLTKVMAVELGPHNIRVNAIAPTVVLTPMGAQVWGDPQKADPVKAKIPRALRPAAGGHRGGAVPGLRGGRHDPRGDADHRRRGQCQTLLRAKRRW